MNFKGFGSPSQDIPMNRITLLFGANSSGKTSIIQSLLLLNQTITEVTDTSTVLLPNGNLVSLGNFREFIHKHDTNRKMQIGITTESGNKMIFSFCLKEGILELSSFKGIAVKWLENNSNIKNWGTILFHGEKADKNHYKVDLINYQSRFDELLSKDQIRMDLIRLIEKRKDFIQRTIQLIEGGEMNITEDYDEKEDYSKRVLNLVFSNIFNSIKHGDPARPRDDLRTFISELSPHEFELTASLLRRFGRKELLKSFDEAIEAVKNRDINTYLEFEEKLAIINPLLYRSSVTPSITTEGNIKSQIGLKKSIITEIVREYFSIPSLESIFKLTNREIHHQLSRLIFLGPLRREPERYYFFSGNVPSSVGKKGDRTAETLFYSDDIKTAVNEKLNNLGIDYRINVLPISSEIKDIFSVRLTDQTLNTDVSISDVGFGISQILPIIVQSYFSTDNIICIEQPEIHIHPRLQTELAQLFYERITENPKLQFIIETHSEHIILRFQRLIRKKLLKPSEISILYFTKEDEGIICKELRMNEKGDFVDAWPEGFFEEAFRERFG